MPSDLANLLVRVTSVGFDEVLENLARLEEAVGRVGNSSGLDQLSRYLKDIHGDMAEMTEGFKKVTDGWQKFGDGVRKGGQEISQQREKLEQHGSMLGTLAKAYASFWVMFNAPRKMFNTLNGIAQFNRQLSTMSVMAMMSRESLLALGVAAGKFGGNAQGIASLASRAGSAMQGMRMGQGGGAFEQAAALYGLNISGTGIGGLATQSEMLRNIVQRFSELTTMEDKLGLKNLLGIDDATFQLMLKGTAEWDKHLKKQAEYQKRLEGVKKQTEAWNEATAELNVEWEILKSQVFGDLAPIIIRIVGWIKEITKDSSKVHELISGISVAAVAVGTAIGAWKLAKFIGEAAKLLGILRNIKSVASGGFNGGIAGGAPGNGAGKLPRVGGGGVGGAASLIELGVESVNAGANIANAMFNAEASNDLRTIANILVAKSTSMEGIHNDKMIGAVITRLDGIHGILLSWHERFKVEEEAKSENTYAMAKAYREGRLDDESFANANGDGRVIHISMNIGTVESSAANYGELVKELVERAKAASSVRLETADWMDSNSGVILA